MAPIGSDIEPVEVPCEDVKMRIDEYEEPLEAEIPRVRINQKNPTNRQKNKKTKIRDMLFSEAGVPLVSKVKELVHNIELNCGMKKNEKEPLRLLLLTIAS